MADDAAELRARLARAVVGRYRAAFGTDKGAGEGLHQSSSAAAEMGEIASPNGSTDGDVDPDALLGLLEQDFVDLLKCIGSVAKSMENVVDLLGADDLKAPMKTMMTLMDTQQREADAAKKSGATYTSHPSSGSERMDHEIVALLRKLALALAVAVAKNPLPSNIESTQAKMLDVPSAEPQTRHALIMVGAPGSGKSKIRDLYWKHKMGGMAKVTIDPDQWSGVFEHDQSLRVWFNYLNHETFLKAMRAKKPLIFDGTGKDLQNTCGRIIDRLHEENYQVTILIVLASYETCLRRIEKRAETTGRGVPETVVEGTFSGLKTSVPFYRNFASNELKDKVHKVHVVNNADADGEPSVDFATTPGDREIKALLASHEMAPLIWCGVNPTTTTIQAPVYEPFLEKYMPIEFRYDPDTSTATFENLEFVRIEQDDATGPTGWYGNVIARKGCASFKFILGMNGVLSKGHGYTGRTYKRWVEFKVASRTNPRVTTTLVAHGIKGLNSTTPEDEIIQFFKDNLQFKNEAQKARLDRLFTRIVTQS